MLAKHALSQLSYAPQCFCPKDKNASRWQMIGTIIEKRLSQTWLSTRTHLACAKRFRGRLTRQAGETLVGRGGLEPPTSRLSGVRSNHLSYRPVYLGRDNAG